MVIYWVSIMSIIMSIIMYNMCLLSTFRYSGEFTDYGTKLDDLATVIWDNVSLMIHYSKTLVNEWNNWFVIVVSPPTSLWNLCIRAVWRRESSMWPLMPPKRPWADQHRPPRDHRGMAKAQKAWAPRQPAIMANWRVHESTPWRRRDNRRPARRHHRRMQPACNSNQHHQHHNNNNTRRGRNQKQQQH